MKNNWPTKKLGEVCEVVGGGTPSTSVSEYWDGNIVWITPKDMGKLDSYEIADSNKKITEAGLKNSSAKLLPKGAVVLSSRAPIGYVAIADIPLATNQGCRSFVCHESKIYNRYFLHFLLTKTELLNHLGGGSTFKEISGSKLKELSIPLPPIGEQKKIVAKLEKVLGKIKEAKKLREEAESAAEALLPAELHKIFSTPHLQHPYKLENVGMSSSGKNGWEEKELGEICELNPKKSEIKDKADDFLVSFVPMSAVDEYLQVIVLLQERNLGDVRKGYTYFRNGDVLFAKITPCMENGKVAIAKKLKNGIGFGTTEFHVIRAKEGVLPEWIHYIVRQPSFREIAKTRMTGSAGQKRVPVHFLEKFKIPLPPLAEQKKIVARLDSLSEKIKSLRQAQDKTTTDFTALEQSVLSQAFSGK